MGRTIYVKTKVAKRLHLDAYPSAGPYPNITGMRNLYWGKDAYIIRSGAYIYKVPAEVFYSVQSYQSY